MSTPAIASRASITVYTYAGRTGAQDRSRHPATSPALPGRHPRRRAPWPASCSIFIRVACCPRAKAAAPAEHQRRCVRHRTNHARALAIPSQDSSCFSVMPAAMERKIHFSSFSLAAFHQALQQRRCVSCGFTTSDHHLGREATSSAGSLEALAAGASADCKVFTAAEVPCRKARCPLPSQVDAFQRAFQRSAPPIFPQPINPEVWCRRQRWLT